MEIQVHAWDWHKNRKYFFTDENCDKYFALMAGVLHYLYSFHPDFYTSENIINIET